LGGGGEQCSEGGNKRIGASSPFKVLVSRSTEGCPPEMKPYKGD